MKQNITDELIAEARGALRRINIHAFPDDLAFQYRGGVLGRNVTEILRDVAVALEAATRERDAALAAVERVRALLGYILPDWSDSGVIAVADILAALDVTQMEQSK